MASFFYVIVGGWPLIPEGFGCTCELKFVFPIRFSRKYGDASSRMKFSFTNAEKKCCEGFSPVRRRFGSEECTLLRIFYLKRRNHPEA